MFAKVKNGVTKSCQCFRWKTYQEKRNFGLKFSIFLSRVACRSLESTSS